MNPYSPNKIQHHPEWLQAIREGKRPAPICVELIPTNRCNHNCVFCIHKAPNPLFNPKAEIKFSKLAEIVNDCAEMGVQAIEVTGGGEPMMHPHFLDLCWLILSHGMDLGLVTNGSLWNRHTTDVLSQATWVRFSIDAGTEEAYAATRGVAVGYGGLQKVRNAVNDLAGTGPTVGVSFVICEANLDTIGHAAENAGNDGADYLRITVPVGTDYDGTANDELDSICDDPFFITIIDALNRRDDVAMCPCRIQHANAYIGADENLYSCCCNAYTDTGYLGTLKGARFKDVWPTAKSVNPANCTRCAYAEKNEAIDAALAEPVHGNFV